MILEIKIMFKLKKMNQRLEYTNIYKNICQKKKIL